MYSLLVGLPHTIKIVPESCHSLVCFLCKIKYGGWDWKTEIPYPSTCSSNCLCRAKLGYRCCLMSNLMWWKHELVRLEHVYTCPLDQSQGNAWRKVETYWVQRCVSVKRRVWTGGGGGSISSLLKL